MHYVIQCFESLYFRAAHSDEKIGHGYFERKRVNATVYSFTDANIQAAFLRKLGYLPYVVPNFSKGRLV